MFNKVNFKCFSKIVNSSQEAIKDLQAGQKILLGGFGLCGAPENLIRAMEQRDDLKNLTVVSNNAGVGDYGLGNLLRKRQIKRMISSYVGENDVFEQQYLNGELEVEFSPQGTLAERLRSAGAGIPAFYTATGVGTVVEQGGFPVLLSKDGKNIVIASEPRERRTFNGRDYIMEQAIFGDIALIKGYKADKKGNVIFRKTAQNFNHDCAVASRKTIVEVEEIVEDGELDPDQIHLPGIYIHKIVKGEYFDKKIERIKTRKPNNNLTDTEYKHTGEDEKREKIAKRAALELRDGMYVNLGIGIPTLVPNYVPKNININLHAENGMIGIGPYPLLEHVDADLTNAGKESVSETNGCVYFKSSDSFAIVRGGHLDITMLGAMQISKYGDIASWIIPNQKVKGMGGAMDLVASQSKVIVVMEHVSAKHNKQHKILDNCLLPLTGKQVVSKLITDLCVFDFEPDKGILLKELQEGVTLEEVVSSTGCKFQIANDLKTIRLH